MDSNTVVYVFMVILSYMTIVIGLYVLATWFTNWFFKRKKKY